MRPRLEPTIAPPLLKEEEEEEEEEESSGSAGASACAAGDDDDDDDDDAEASTATPRLRGRTPPCASSGVSAIADRGVGAAFHTARAHS